MYQLRFFITQIAAGLLITASTTVNGGVTQIYSVKCMKQLLGCYYIFYDDDNSVRSLEFVRDPDAREGDFILLDWLSDCLNEDKQETLKKLAEQPIGQQHIIPLAMVPGLQAKITHTCRSSFAISDQQDSFTLCIYKYDELLGFCSISCFRERESIIYIERLSLELKHESPLLRINGYRLLNQLACSFSKPVDIYRCQSSEGKAVAMEYWQRNFQDMKPHIEIMEQLSKIDGCRSVQLLASFPFHGHTVIIEELAESSLSDFQEKFSQSPTLSAFKTVLRLMLEALSSLDRAGYTHNTRHHDWLFFDGGTLIKLTGHERMTHETKKYTPVRQIIYDLIEESILKDNWRIVRPVSAQDFLANQRPTALQARDRKEGDKKDITLPRRVYEPVLQSKWMSRSLFQTLSLMANYRELSANNALQLTDLTDYQEDLAASSIPGHTLKLYQAQLSAQLQQAGLTTQDTPADGHCLIHAVTQNAGVPVQEALAAISEHFSEDPVFAAAQQNDLAHLSSGQWGSPTILPPLADWLGKAIILLMPNIQTGEVIIQVYMPGGFAPLVSTLQEALNHAGNDSIVIAHNGIGHFLATFPENAPDDGDDDDSPFTIFGYACTLF
ncbi:MAG: hypothetical protein ACR2PT_01840 [Endozoicomonas sp.]